MIVYRLVCKDCKITFDSWFSSSKEYEKLKEQKLLNCHACNSLNIEKTLMSPNVFRIKKNTKINNQNRKYKEVKEKISEYKNFIKKNFDYVGENFSYEARSIHYENKKTSRGIYGTATKKEIKELKEEGVETEIIPWVTKTTN